MIHIAIFGATLIIGMVVGYAMHRLRARRLLAAAEASAQESRTQARRAADLMMRESSARAGEERLEIERAAAKEQRAYHEECQLIAERVRKLTARLQRREQVLAEQQRAIDQRRDALHARADETKQAQQQVAALEQAFRGGLEDRAGLTAAEARDQLVSTIVAAERASSADRLRNLETNRAEEFDRWAKRIMGIAMQRYGGHCPRERGASTIALQPKQLERLQAEDGGRIKTLSEMTGAELTISDEGDALRIDAPDAITRELCRRAVNRFIAEEKVGSAERLVASLQKGLQRDIGEYGNKAFKALALERAAPEIEQLVGKLNWRTSYTQNQYHHSIEAAVLAGLMADELGLDTMIARRGTLLHDLGKSLTPQIEGSHALIGAEIARRNGEPEAVANAIGAHHGEEPMGSPYAWLAAAADAMSGGRPGARREIADSYGDRIGDLERVASGFAGVLAVHAVQAGRELRIHVDEHQIGDDGLEGLSEKIARQISEELVFPGQIRVTVIREFRAVAHAS